MLRYKNISSYPLTFYGITFNPNEIKEVSGYINHPKMIRIKEQIEPKPKITIQISEAKNKSDNIETKVDQKPKRQYNKRNKQS